MVGTPVAKARKTLDALTATGLIVRTIRRHGVRAVGRGVEALWDQDSIRAAEALVVDVVQPRAQGKHG